MNAYLDRTPGLDTSSIKDPLPSSFRDKIGFYLQGNLESLKLAFSDASRNTLFDWHVTPRWVTADEFDALVARPYTPQLDILGKLPSITQLEKDCLTWEDNKVLAQAVREEHSEHAVIHQFTTWTQGRETRASSPP